MIGLESCMARGEGLKGATDQRMKREREIELQVYESISVKVWIRNFRKETIKA